MGDRKQCKAVTRKGDRCERQTGHPTQLCPTHRKPGTPGSPAGLTAQAEANQQKALGLRTQGRTYQQIADECGYADRASAFNAVRSAIERLAPVEQVNEWRTVNAARYELMIETLWPYAIGEHPDGRPTVNEDGIPTGPSIRAQDTIRKHIDSQARLLGLNAPTVTQIVGTGDNGQIEVEVLTPAEKRAAIETTLAQVRPKVMAMLNPDSMK